MQHNITTMEDVRVFLEQIANEIDDFHLLTDFADYVWPNSFFRRYNDEEVTIRNRALEQCMKVCEVYTDDCFEYLPWYYGLIRVQMVKPNCSTGVNVKRRNAQLALSL